MSNLQTIAQALRLDFESEPNDETLVQTILEACKKLTPQPVTQAEQQSDLSLNAQAAVDVAFEEGKLRPYQRSWAVEFAERDLEGFLAEMEKRIPTAPRQLSQLALNFAYPHSGSPAPHARINLKQITALSGLSEQQLNTLLKGECLHD